MKNENTLEKIKQLLVVRDKEFRKILLIINAGMVFIVIAFVVMFGDTKPLSLQTRDILLVTLGLFVGANLMFAWLSWNFYIKDLNYYE